VRGSRDIIGRLAPEEVDRNGSDRRRDRWKWGRYFRTGVPGQDVGPGLCIHALGEVDGRDVEPLRFDCFDHQPHYHYGPENKNERLMLDPTTEGDALEWALTQSRTRLPEMVRRAGYEGLADGIEPEAVESTLGELATTARRMARERRSTVMHDRGGTRYWRLGP